MGDRKERDRGGGREARCALALALPLIAGCAVGPDYAAPEPELPDVWHMELSRGLEGGEGDLRTWWKALDDPILDSLIARASAGSLDLRVAYARVMEARAQRGVARGQWFPGLDANGSYTKGRTTESLAQLQQPPSRDFDRADLGLDASWELDVFGRIRRSTESADASLLASVEDYRDVLVILYADVATTYVEVRSLQQRLRYAVSNAELQRDTLQLTRDRNEAGLAGDLDVRQAELNLARTEASIPLLESQLGQAIHALGVLLGAEPAALYEVLGPQAPIPSVPEAVAVGIPANLMRQRPDVRSAERQLAAQTAQIGVATADLYPRFSLVGSFAFDALDAAELFSSGSTRGGIGPTVQWNIFDGGRIRNNIRVEDARTEQALARYEQTVLAALQDVEDALVGYTRELERRDMLARSVVAAEESVKLVMTLYRTGLTNFQNVLDMERSLFQQQDQLAESEGLVVQNLVRLYRALGGGWDPTALPMPSEPAMASQP
jgi:NodT family efflux transporter outer membrane factor (OMF) lipoprotein